MTKAMNTIQDLIEEAKLRTVWWALCIFCVSYFLSHTSKSMWMNVPLAILLVSLLRILVNEVEFRWKVRQVRQQSYLSRLEKKQLSRNDPRLSTAPPPRKWKRKIDSPVVEAAMSEFISKLLKDFVVDLWYSDITPDKEVPELMHAVIMDALGEISARVKEINLVDLLTKDIVDLIGHHLDLFRRNQAAIGVDVMATLSTEERDERLKFHLMASKELHPALISAESEYKVLQHLIGGLLAVILKPQESQCPLVRSIARELVTCLVMQPVMNLASPGYINELIESLSIALTADKSKDVGADQSKTAAGHNRDHLDKHDSSSTNIPSSNNQGYDMALTVVDNKRETYLDSNLFVKEPVQTQPKEWARILEAATQRRTEVLAPENLENMWTKGRNYKKKEQKKLKTTAQEPVGKGSAATNTESTRNLGRETLGNRHGGSTKMEGKRPASSIATLPADGINNKIQLLQDLKEGSSFQERHIDQVEGTGDFSASGNACRLKRSNSTSDLKMSSDTKKPLVAVGTGTIIPDFFTGNFGARNEEPGSKRASNLILRNEGEHVPKLRCRVMGASFEKLGSKSFAVYSIAVTDAENRTWFVERRYSNFERLHRHLKDIPNYTLHLPPKRIFSSSTEDAFVYQRCIQLDKYLQDLLSIANVAEQHEVWDFLSASSKNYSFVKSSSVMRSLAVNVDDAVDDIVRQFRGVSDGLMRKVVSPSSPLSESISSAPSRGLSWNTEEINRQTLGQSATESMNSVSDNEDNDRDGSSACVENGSSTQATGWHSDNELNLKSFAPLVVRSAEESQNLGLETTYESEVKYDGTSLPPLPAGNTQVNSINLADPIGMPPEWSPPNVSVPLLNLVDKVFQLKQRGWIRRQVFWISKQILHLVMEDAIDDWLLRQMHWLRQEETVAQGIRWLQDVLWPNGTFFTKLRNTGSQIEENGASCSPLDIRGQLANVKVSKPGSFEEQLEAARRARDVKKMIYDRAPATLVSLIGNKQYKRCARDIYNFLQSTICMKQLAYSALEILLISVFPELRNHVKDVHLMTFTQQPA